MLEIDSRVLVAPTTPSLLEVQLRSAAVMFISRGALIYSPSRDDRSFMFYFPRFFYFSLQVIHVVHFLYIIRFKCAQFKLRSISGLWKKLGRTFGSNKLFYAISLVSNIRPTLPKWHSLQFGLTPWALSTLVNFIEPFDFISKKGPDA